MLVQVNLINANLHAANFTDAKIYYSDLTGANLSDIVFESTSVQKFMLEDPPMDRAQRVKAIRSGFYALIRGTTLTGADLTNAIMETVNFNDLKMVGANLTNAHLRYSLLDTVDLSGANLTNADLIGSNLEHVNLSNAELTNADLYDVIWIDTTCPDGTNSNDHGNTCCGHLNGKLVKAGCP